MRTRISLSPRNMDQETLLFIWPVDMDTVSTGEINILARYSLKIAFTFP